MDGHDIDEIPAGRESLFVTRHADIMDMYETAMDRRGRDLYRDWMQHLKDFPNGHRDWIKTGFKSPTHLSFLFFLIRAKRVLIMTDDKQKVDSLRIYMQTYKNTRFGQSVHMGGKNLVVAADEFYNLYSPSVSATCDEHEVGQTMANPRYDVNVFVPKYFSIGQLETMLKRSREFDVVVYAGDQWDTMEMRTIKTMVHDIIKPKWKVEFHYTVRRFIPQNPSTRRDNSLEVNRKRRPTDRY